MSYCARPMTSPSKKDPTPTSIAHDALSVSASWISNT